jgi:hypothetical protein
MSLLDQLHTDLQGLLAAIAAGPAAGQDGPTLVERLAQVDDLAQKLEGQAPPMLMHYLEKRSYTKAVDFLEGRDETAKPNC